jgi:hypothetical protein
VTLLIGFGDQNADISLGKNLRTKAKSKVLTGCKEFPRKPIHEHGKGRKVFDLTDDPFSSQPSLPPRTPTESEYLLGDSMSVDQSGDAGPHISSTPPSKYNDFDTLFSSSPEAQSTPRIRLEPSFGAGGRKTLKNVPADSRSLFDPDNSDIVGQYSDIDVDAEPVTNMMTADAVKRKGSQLRAPSLGIESPHKRAKKHPSPSKADLEQWGEAMEVYKDSVQRNGDDSAPTGLSQISTVPVLAAADPNGKIGEWKQPKKGEMTRAAESMPNLTGRTRTTIVSSVVSTKEKAGKRHSRQYSKQKYTDEGSEMDIDELQLDNSAYHIGMGRL